MKKNKLDNADAGSCSGNQVSRVGYSKNELGLDQVILVDSDDKKIGVMDKIEAHRGSGKLHRAISVFLFNDRGRLLIQQRSQEKIVGAGMWANTACGNVRPQESYLGCAKRRLNEELGIVGAELEKVGKFQYQVSFENAFSENEIDTVFVGKYGRCVEPNPSEVNNYSWVQFGKNCFDGKRVAPWVGVIFNNDEIYQSLELFCEGVRRKVYQ